MKNESKQIYGNRSLEDIKEEIKIKIKKTVKELRKLEKRIIGPKKEDKIFVQTKLINDQYISAKPFLKWAGGKRQILNEIEQRLPSWEGIDRYVEPFVGGGAVFFFLQSEYKIRESYLLDNNKELLVGYLVVQRNYKELIKKLKILEKEYIQKSETKRKEFFYQQRDEYNNQMLNFDYTNYNKEWIDKAVYLIFLNRTCFNGLFRQNSKGEFNVPFGRYKNPKICDEENIFNVHQALKNTEIIHGDFEESGIYIDENTFVYFDPPYRPISSTANFTDYVKGGFNDNEQIRLAKFFKELDKKDAYLMLSNSDSKNNNPNDNFFDDLYQGFNIERIKAKRAISSDVNTRGEITELLIRNYPK
jgi:DNA adenine methylase